MLGQECLATDCLSILNFLGLSVCFFLIFHPPSWAHFSTGKSLSEAQLTHNMTKYCSLNYKLKPGENMLCIKIVLNVRSSAKRRASDKDLPVLAHCFSFTNFFQCVFLKTFSFLLMSLCAHSAIGSSFYYLLL